jgi:hypothetical protein
LFRSKRGREFLSSGGGMNAIAFNVEREMREILPRVLAHEPCKIIAFKAGALPRTAKAWKRGDHLPQAHHMLMLERAYPELAAEMRRLRFLQADMDPRAEDLAAQLVRYAMEKVGHG